MVISLQKNMGGKLGNPLILGVSLGKLAIDRALSFAMFEYRRVHATPTDPIFQRSISVDFSHSKLLRKGVMTASWVVVHLGYMGSRE